MGYTTYFMGAISIDPPLNQDEIDYLHDFAQSRRMNRTGGPYIADPGNDHGQYGTPFGGGRTREPKDQLIDYNQPPDGQPGLWCQWIPEDDDGVALIWDEGEKFYNSVLWMEYLIEHFLKPGAKASKDPSAVEQDERIKNFTFDHVLNGTIYASGEDDDDKWKLVVSDNSVAAYDGVTVYEDEILEMASEAEEAGMMMSWFEETRFGSLLNLKGSSSA